jgi:hypothetical protein
MVLSTIKLVVLLIKGTTLLNADDRQQITETLALHAYLSDEHRLDRFEELFAPDAVYDMRRSGMGVFEGIAAIRAAAERMIAGGHMPQAHFVTNILIADAGEAGATARSKGLMVMADGSLHAVTHDDVLRRHDGGWRLSRRVISPTKAPVPAAGAAAAAGGPAS